MKRSIKYFVQNKIVKGTSYYLRNEQINPLWFISKVRCCSIFIHDVYIDWYVPYITYSPKCYLGRLLDFIWWYAPCNYNKYTYTFI